MCLSLIGCKEEDKSFNAKKVNQFENMNITFHYSEIVEKIYPTVAFNESYYYEPIKEEQNFLDFIMTVENKSKETLRLNNILSANINVDGSQKVGDLLFETIDGTSLEKTLSLESNQKTKIHIYTSVSKKEEVEKIKMDLNVDGETYVLKTTFSNIQPIKTYKKEKDKITFSKEWEMTLENLTTTKELKPSKPSGTYNYYTASDDHIFVVLKTNIQNITKESLPLKGMVGTVFYVNGVAYDSYCVMENEKHSNLSDDSTNSIGNNKTMTVYYFAEIPNVKESDLIEVRLTNINEQFYMK